MVWGERGPGTGTARGTSRDGGKNKGSGNGEGVGKVARVRECRERGSVNGEERLIVHHKSCSRAKREAERGAAKRHER